MSSSNDNDYSCSANSFRGHSEPCQIFDRNSLMITPNLIRAVGMSAKYVMVHAHLGLMLRSYPQMHQCSLLSAMREHQPMNICIVMYV